MSDIDQEQVNPTGNQAPEEGFLHIEETTDTSTSPTQEVHPSDVKPPTSPQVMARSAGTGTIEHLAARRPTPELDSEAPAVKQRLSELRTEVTRLVTGVRWNGLPVEEAAAQMLPLLNVNVQQWKSVLIPYLFEIDRAGNLIPVWLKIIEQEDPTYLAPDANPAETMEGRAKRIAILMLGNYKVASSEEKKGTLGFSRQSVGAKTATPIDLPQLLGKLAIDPDTSLYATQSLVKIGTNDAIQALITALKDAEGWAKVDVAEGIVALNLARFHDLLIAAGLERVPGLESYVAVPIYRAIPLENYLRSKGEASLRLTQQAALIFQRVLQDSMTPPATADAKLPVAFERDLAILAPTLFEEARSMPIWQNVLAMHALGTFMGRYWSEISSGRIQDERIITPIYACLPMMHDVERWMSGPGRDVLLDTLNDPEVDESSLTPLIKVIGELRDPRATSALIARVEAVRMLTDRFQALALDAICTTLGRIGDRRSTASMLQLISKVVDTGRRAGHTKRRDNLPSNDADIPGSIVYAAVVRACGYLGDPAVLDSIIRANRDFDPFVRTQALDALKRLDPAGADVRSRQAVRDALNDPRESIARLACQLVVQYRDVDALSTLHYLADTRPEVAPAALDAIRQLGH